MIIAYISYDLYMIFLDLQYPPFFRLIYIFFLIVIVLILKQNV